MKPEGSQTPTTAAGPPPKPRKLDTIKDITAVIQSILTIIALIAAGIWFTMRAETTPKANISHTLVNEPITEKWTWVHVGVVISNPGVRRLELRRGTFRIQGVMPVADIIREKIAKGEPIIPKEDGIVKWPTIRKIYGDENEMRVMICENEYENKEINVDIDPGESQKIVVEFLVPSFVEAVRVYSHVYRDASFWEKVKAFCAFEKAKYEWSEVSIYDLKKNKGVVE